MFDARLAKPSPSMAENAQAISGIPSGCLRDSPSSDSYIGEKVACIGSTCTNEPLWLIHACIRSTCTNEPLALFTALARDSVVNFSGNGSRGAPLRERG